MSVLGSIFGGGDKQPAAPPTPPSPPSRDDAMKAAQDEVARKRAQANAGGLESTILTSGAGDTSSANIGKKTLLGQ